MNLVADESVDKRIIRVALAGELQEKLPCRPAA